MNHIAIAGILGGLVLFASAPAAAQQGPGSDVNDRPHGERIETGYAPGYIQAVLDWASRGRLDGHYGDGEILAGAR